MSDFTHVVSLGIAIGCCVQDMDQMMGEKQLQFLVSRSGSGSSKRFWVKRSTIVKQAMVRCMSTLCPAQNVLEFVH